MKNKFLVLCLSMLCLGFTSNVLAQDTQNNTRPAQTTDGILAEVNNEIILKSELSAAIATLTQQYQAQNRSVSAEQLKKQALDELITRKLQLGIIKRSGFNPNESAVNAQLLQLAKAQGFDNLQDFQQSLDTKKSGSYAALRKQVIEEASLVALWQAQVAPRIKITSHEIDAFLNSPDGQRIDSKVVLVPEWQTSHILASIDNNRNDIMAQQKINAIYTQLQQGADFKSLAATYSDDLGSASQNGSLGWVSEGQMVKEFEDVMKNTEAGDYSVPFRSQFGWHILKVDDTRQRDVTHQQRQRLAREILFNRMAPQAEEDWVQELRAGAYIKIFE